MYLVRVIPIKKGVISDSLDYLSEKDIPPGALVLAPSRTKQIVALVLSSVPAQEVKQEIKTSPYRLKKIEKIITERFFLHDFVRMSFEIAAYYAGMPGGVLSHFFPSRILETYLKKPKSYEQANPPLAPRPILKWPGPRLLQMPDEARHLSYKSRVRESFARGASVLIIAPTVNDVLFLSRQISRGIEEHTFTLHSDMSARVQAATWKKALTAPARVLIIASPVFLGIPRENIDTIIIEKENSPLYKTQRRPFIDTRHAAKKLCEIRNITYIAGDILLRSETLFERERGMTHPLSDVKSRIVITPRPQIITMEKEEKGKKPTILSTKAQEIIHDAYAKKEGVFIFAMRRGLAPTTYCADCGSIFSCPHCHAPLVLYKKTENRIFLKKGGNKIVAFFLCHYCGTSLSAHVKCPRCHSARLTPGGIGTQTIKEFLSKSLPAEHIAIFDSSTISTHKEAQNKITMFYNGKIPILIGTEMAPSYLHEPLSHTIIASFDPFLAIPDYKIKERALAFLLRIAERTQKTFILQTRNPDAPLFKHFIKGDLLNFYREEIRERKKYAYPPFSLLIKVSVYGKQNDVLRDTEELLRLFEEYDAVSYPSFQSSISKKRVVGAHILLRVKPKEWPNKKLLSVLYELSPRIVIDVAPTQLL